jgi:NAD(P)-dependent dehydrogenase (short-subunit alcohol dehydrogenase family)
VYSEIASNKRRSVIFIVLFFLIWLAIGAALGFLFKAVAHPAANPGFAPAPQTNYGWSPVIVGIAICGVLAFGGLSASKAALNAISDALRMELKHQGVHVSYIESGGLDTSFFATATEAQRRDGYTGSAETQAIYTRAIDTAATALADSPRSSVEDAARAIERALTDRRPAAHYRVGRDTRFVLPILRHLPASIRDRLVMTNLGLTHDTFAAA